MDRLKALELVPLRSPIAKAIELYGEPDNVEPDESIASATAYTFEVSPFHAVQVIEWKGIAHFITYESAYNHPKADLKTLGDFYGDELEWETRAEGYSYVRSDGDRLIFCSAMPILTVSSPEYMDEYQKANAQADDEHPAGAPINE